MEKLTITKLFKNAGDDEKKKRSSEMERMIELNKAFELPNEIIRENKVKPLDEKTIQTEANRNKQILNRINEWNPPMGNTVNTFFQQPGETVNTFLDNKNPNTNKLYNPNYAYLQAAEAIRLAISRTLNSGAPVNNLGFYEEINKELNNLGFNPKSPLDIKNTLFAMIKD